MFINNELPLGLGLHTQTFYGSFAHLSNTFCLLSLSSLIYYDSLRENLRFPVFIAKEVSVIVVGALCASIAVQWRRAFSAARRGHIGRRLPGAAPTVARSGA